MHVQLKVVQRSAGKVVFFLRIGFLCFAGSGRCSWLNVIGKLKTIQEDGGEHIRQEIQLCSKASKFLNFLVRVIENRNIRTKNLTRVLIIH